MLSKTMKLKSHYLSAAVITIIGSSALYFASSQNDAEFECQSESAMVQKPECSDTSSATINRQPHAKSRNESLLNRFFGNDKAPNFHFLDVLELLK